MLITKSLLVSFTFVALLAQGTTKLQSSRDAIRSRAPGVLTTSPWTAPRGASTYHTRGRSRSWTRTMAR
jgi:hypothetical protein